MRILVCGGRAFKDEMLLIRELDKIKSTYGPFEYLIEGGARGADTMARYWAGDNAIRVRTFHADWSLGKQAGYIRNRSMLDDGQPDLVVAFPGGKGTAMMVKIAKEAGVKVIEVSNDKEKTPLE